MFINGDWLELTGTLDTRPTLDTIKHQFFAEAFVHESAVLTTVTTVDVQNGLTIFEVGHTNGGQAFIYNDGSNGTTSAFADYSGTVAGTVKATDADHGLITGDIITIEGGNDYAGIYQITRIDDDNFYFTAVWNDDDGAQPWSQPDYIESTIVGNADFKLTLSIACSSANQTLEIHIFRNTEEITHFKIENHWGTANDVFSIGTTGVDPVAVGDRFWVGIANNTSTANLTVKNGNFTIVELI